MARHDLKILPEYFQEAVKGFKTFEIRKNDRNFNVDDDICLKEFDGKNYTGNYLLGIITYLTDFKQKEGYVVFSYLTAFIFNQSE